MGAGGHHSDCFRELVGGVSQRLVLAEYPRTTISPTGQSSIQLSAAQNRGSIVLPHTKITVSVTCVCVPQILLPCARRQFGAAFCALLLVGAACARAQSPASSAGPAAAHQEQPANPDQQQEDQSSKPSLITPLAPKTESEPYRPITARQRLRWLITNTIGPPHLAGGLVTSAFGTALDRPKEYGPGWPGFGERFGIRLSGVSTSNTMEASVGALWGEDPRYFRVPEESFGARLRNVTKQTFLARRRNGNFAPAYARFVAIPGSNFLSNTWRPDSEANNHDAVLRTLEGFAGRMSANAFEEFWPDVTAHLFLRRQ